MGNSVACVSDRAGSKRHSTCVGGSVRGNEYINRTVPSGETLLTIAAQEERGGGYLAQRLIAQGADVNQVNTSGCAPLHVAIRSHNEDVVNVLLDSGADVNVRDRSGLTALHLACATRNKSVVRKLLEYGCNPEGMADGKFYVSTPLMAATENDDKALAVLLLSYSADVDKRDWWQNTALLKAVQVGSIGLVDLLLRHGADPNVENRFGGSALHYSTIADHCEITRMLVMGGCRVNPRKPFRSHNPHQSSHHANSIRNSSHYGNSARSSSHGNSLRNCSGRGSSSGWTDTHRGSNIHSRSSRDFSRSSSRELSRGGSSSGGSRETIVRHSPLAAAIHRACQACFEFLVDDAGADVDAEDARKKTPLIYAVTDRAWDCGGRHGQHCSAVIPQCSHSDNPTSVDSTRLRFALELVDRGARVRPLWEYVVWQMRSVYVCPDDSAAISLCIRAMGFVHREDFKAETFYRTLSQSGQWQCLWLLYLAGYCISDEAVTSTLNRSRGIEESRESEYRPERWLSSAVHKPRALKNLCVIVIREHLPDNVIYSARKLNLPNVLYNMVTLNIHPV